VAIDGATDGVEVYVLRRQPMCSRRQHDRQTGRPVGRLNDAADHAGGRREELGTMQRPDRVPEEAPRRVRRASHELDRIVDQASEEMPVAHRRRQHVMEEGGGERGDRVGDRAGRLDQIEGDGARRLDERRQLASLLGRDREDGVDERGRRSRRFPSSGRGWQRDRDPDQERARE
jgi:hypothetical protein